MKIFPRYILIFLLLSFGTPSMFYAQTCVLQGRITDESTGQPVGGATVCISGLDRNGFSDDMGRFRIQNLTPGGYEIRIGSIGYETRSVTTEVRDSSPVKVEVQLAPSTLNLTEILVTNSREAHQTSALIGSIDLHLRPTRSSQDVLRLIPGLITAQHAGGGKAEQIFLRGFDIDHGTDIRVTVDGMPVNMVSHAHGQGYADLHFVIPETIEKVDFDKGPYYAAQGDFTTAGYADFKTRNGLDRSMLKLETGRFATQRAVGMVDLLGKTRDDQNAYLASELVFSNGPFESPQHFRRLNLMGRFNGRIGRDKVLDVALSTFSSRWNGSGQIPDRAVRQGRIGRFGAIDDTEGGSTGRTNGSLRLHQTFDNGDWLKNQVYYVRNNFELFSNFTFFLEDPVNGDQIRQFEDRNIYGYNLVYGLERHAGRIRFRTEAGMSLRYDRMDRTELSKTRSRRDRLGYAALGDIDQLNAGFHIEEAIRLTDRFSIRAGLRIDRFSFGYVDALDSVFRHTAVQAHTVNPKISLYYDLSPSVQVYLKSGSGFHSNDARVVVAKDGVQALPRAVGADLGAFFKPTPRLLVNAAAWWLDLEQEFVYVGDAAVVEPSGATRRYGLDLSARYQLADWLFFDADLNYAVPRFRQSPEETHFIPLATTFTSAGGLSTRFGRGLNGSLRYRHVADRPANEENSVTARGYFLLDGGLTYTARKLELGLSFENILDVEWNEAQFDTESRLFDEPLPVTELHYTPGTPFFVKGSVSVFF
jgi:hypothetical protein